MTGPNQRLRQGFLALNRAWVRSRWRMSPALFGTLVPLATEADPADGVIRRFTSERDLAIKLEMRWQTLLKYLHALADAGEVQVAMPPKNQNQRLEVRVLHYNELRGAGAEVAPAPRAAGAVGGAAAGARAGAETAPADGQLPAATRVEKLEKEEKWRPTPSARVPSPTSNPQDPTDEATTEDLASILAALAAAVGEPANPSEQQAHLDAARQIFGEGFSADDVTTWCRSWDQPWREAKLTLARLMRNRHELGGVAAVKRGRLGSSDMEAIRAALEARR